jgi:hypothetical protein
MVNKKLLVFAGAALLALPLTAPAENQEQLIERYTALAGSKQNATSLVTGLREGKQVTLTRGDSKETFTPPTDKMGYGNVDHALALAEASLQEKGITRPTPAQLEAALMGGNVTVSGKTVPLEGVLQMRADGKGWGQIAQSLGFKLGEVKRADRAQPNGAARPERVSRVERPEKPEKPERPERPEKPERPGKGR